MLNFEKPIYKITEYIEDKNYGKFELEPLERGFGTTLGNALRRIMLSSMPGSAIVAVKIDGVMHEFQTMEGIVEDVTTIVLNLKNIVVKNSSTEEKVLKLRFGLDDGRQRTLEEVGKEFNVTRERIRQIEAKALRKLRHPSRSKKLKDYLD